MNRSHTSFAETAAFLLLDALQTSTIAAILINCMLESLHSLVHVLQRRTYDNSILIRD